MTQTEVPREPIQINKRLLVPGAVLIGVGGLCGAAGVLLATSALVTASKQWVKQLETPPNEMVRQRLQQARTAGAAAAEAWRTNKIQGVATSH